MIEILAGIIVIFILLGVAVSVLYGLGGLSFLGLTFLYDHFFEKKKRKAQEKLESEEFNSKWKRLMEGMEGVKNTDKDRFARWRKWQELNR